MPSGVPSLAAHVSNGREPARAGRWRLPHRTINLSGAGPDDILASDARPLPMVRSTRRPARQAVGAVASLAVHRGGPGPRAADRHDVDPGRGAERAVPVLL